MAENTQHLQRIKAVAKRNANGFTIKAAVGDWSRGAVNNLADVETVQYLLEFASTHQKRPEFDPHGVDGKISRTKGKSSTVKAIVAFQRPLMKKPDGVVEPDGTTMQKLRDFVISEESRQQGVARSVMQAPHAGDGKPPWLGFVTVSPAQKPLLPEPPPSSPTWIPIAEKELGVKEKKKKGEHEDRILEFHKTTTTERMTDENPWCASFVNWVIEKAGYEGTDSAWSHSWKRWGDGLAKPAVGAVAVIDWGLVHPDNAKAKGTGHVGFVVGKAAGDNIVLLGGNQSDKVKYAGFKRKHIIAYRVPKGFKVLNEHYQLPILKIDKGGGGFASSR